MRFPQRFEHLGGNRFEFVCAVNRAVIETWENLHITWRFTRQSFDARLEQRDRLVQEKRILPANDQANALFEDRPIFLWVARQQIVDVISLISLRLPGIDL